MTTTLARRAAVGPFAWRRRVRVVDGLGISAGALFEAIVDPRLPRRVVGVRDRVTGHESDSEEHASEQSTHRHSGVDSTTTFSR